MKKIICLLAGVLMIASVAFAAEMITDKDLPGLKGTWEGMLAWGISGAANSNVKLEILNDTVPVSMKLTVTNVPDVVAWRLGAMPGNLAASSEEGEITTQGTLMFVGPAKNYLELSIVNARKLNGWYYYRGVKGDLTVFKK